MLTPPCVPAPSGAGRSEEQLWPGLFLGLSQGSVWCCSAKKLQLNCVKSRLQGALGRAGVCGAQVFSHERQDQWAGVQLRLHKLNLPLPPGSQDAGGQRSLASALDSRPLSGVWDCPLCSSCRTSSGTRPLQSHSRALVRALNSSTPGPRGPLKCRACTPHLWVPFGAHAGGVWCSMELKHTFCYFANAGCGGDPASRGLHR